MHRKRTRLAARAHRVATSLERRGVRATYRLHDHVLSNRRSKRLYRRERPALDPVQQRIVDALDTEGFALLPLSELVDDATLAAVGQQGASFMERTETALRREASGERDETLRRRQGKEFVIREWSYDGVALGPGNPWFSLCLSHRMLDVANAYLRMWSVLAYVDVWYSVPQAEGTERIASQRWHRDYDDRHLLKAFLYLVDVDEYAGPFEYVPGSARNGPYARAWPWRPLGENYPSPEALAERIPETSIKTFTAPQGTLIFCDTSGFHRGGFTTVNPRVLATATYESPASLASLTERSYTFSGSRDELDAVQAYAVG